MQQTLRKSFRPEFINRLDEIVMYKPLLKSEIASILEILIKDLNKRLSDKQITLKLTEAAKTYLIDNGYNPSFGARPLKSFVQRKLETLIARSILEEKVKPNSESVVDFDGTELRLGDDQ